MTWALVFLLAFAYGAVGEYYADLWTIRWNGGTTGPLPAGWQAFRRRVWRMIFLGAGLRLIGSIDTGTVFGGPWAYVAMALGSQIGGAVATWREMHRRYGEEGGHG